jgi:cytochrome c oxidase subunit II
MTTDARPSMHMDPYERGWIIATVVLLVVFVAAITVAGFSMGIQVPSPQGRVNPQTVGQEGAFAQPGLREIAPGKYEVYILAQIWRFDPNEITIPVGSTVTFYVTSKDVQHGFQIEGTNVNMQIVPGQISKLGHRFDKPGEYLIICHEYCGTGHAAMYGKVIVTP